MVEKTLTGKRVAFSAFGVVAQMSGSPVNTGKVIATCDDCDKSEEAILN